MTRRRIPKLALCLFLFAAVMCIFIGRKFWPFDGTYVIDRFQLQQGQTLEIRGRIFWEIARPVLYRIRGTTEEINGFVGTLSDPDVDVNLELLTADDGRLVAVVERSSPGIILILHDTRTNESWPGGAKGDTYDETIRRGDRLLNRLRQYHSDPKLMLSHDITGERRAKING